MDPMAQPAKPPVGITTLDLLLFTAGFACGWAMHQASTLRTVRTYVWPVIPNGSALRNVQFHVGGFQSHLGMVWTGWLWAFVIGLAFLILGRHFRYDGRYRCAEWLAVALAIVLFESVYPAFTVESWAKKWWIATCLAAAAAVIAIARWHFRAKLGPGPVAVLVFAMAVLVTLGPLRLAEATSIDKSSDAPNDAYEPSANGKPWIWTWQTAYFDARAWGGYTLRALALMVLAKLTARSLLTRWRYWLWTEWAALATASIMAGFWLYDEFVARPALDRMVHVMLLGAWLFVIAIIAGVSLFVSGKFGRRLHRAGPACGHGSAP
jgi:hypothetical protein